MFYQKSCLFISFAKVKDVTDRIIASQIIDLIHTPGFKVFSLPFKQMHRACTVYNGVFLEAKLHFVEGTLKHETDHHLFHINPVRFTCLLFHWD